MPEQRPGANPGSDLGTGRPGSPVPGGAGSPVPGSAASPVPGSAASPVPGSAASPVPGSAAPRYQWPAALVLSTMTVALAVVAADHFRRGSVLFAAGVVLAFFLRLILGEASGWLAVRSRTVDLACLGALGIGLTVFALIVPPPS